MGSHPFPFAIGKVDMDAETNTNVACERTFSRHAPPDLTLEPPSFPFYCPRLTTLVQGPILIKK